MVFVYLKKIHLLEFQVGQKIVKKPHEYLSWKILILTWGIVNTTENDLRQNYTNRLGQNFIRTGLTEGISSQLVVGKQWKNLTTGSFLTKNIFFLSLSFNQFCKAHKVDWNGKILCPKRWISLPKCSLTATYWRLTSIDGLQAWRVTNS